MSLNKSNLFCVSLAVIGVAIWLGPTHTIIYFIDSTLFIFNSLDGVEEFNTKQPNYVDGNWQPIHQELNRVTVEGKGNLPNELKGGMYVRNGAVLKCWPPGRYVRKHQFYGEAMIHRYVQHRNRISCKIGIINQSS